MEDVLEVYKRPYDPRRPVVCIDETTKQLIGETREPLPPRPGSVERFDHVYVRNGVASLFLAFEPLKAWRTVAVTDHRRRLEWAEFIRALLTGRYRRVEKLVLVMDQLNTHSAASLYEAFPPATAKRLADRLEIHHTPKHGSWLNMAEIELSVLGRECLDRRIAQALRWLVKSNIGSPREIDAKLPSIGNSPLPTRESNSAGFTHHLITDRPLARNREIRRSTIPLQEFHTAPSSRRRCRRYRSESNQRSRPPPIAYGNDGVHYHIVLFAEQLHHRCRLRVIPFARRFVVKIFAHWFFPRSAIISTATSENPVSSIRLPNSFRRKPTADSFSTSCFRPPPSLWCSVQVNMQSS